MLARGLTILTARSAIFKKVGLPTSSGIFLAIQLPSSLTSVIPLETSLSAKVVNFFLTH